MRENAIKVLFALLLILGLPACVQFGGLVVLPDKEKVAARILLTKEIKAYQARLGWNATDNFLRYSEAFESIRFCGHAGEFDFDTHDFRAEKNVCLKKDQRRDAVYSEFEAVAGSAVPLSPSSVNATLERFIYLIFHEDFHEQVRDIPSLALNESATQLVSLIAARDFAREKYGESSAAYRSFARDIETSIQGAHIETRYYRELSLLYALVAKKKVNREMALNEKERLYRAMQDECKDIVLSVANSCKDITNNVLFKWNIAYSLHYPLFYSLNRCLGGDTVKTGRVIVALTAKKLTEAEFLRKTEEMIKGGCES